jgi:putative membrane protein
MKVPVSVFAAVFVFGAGATAMAAAAPLNNSAFLHYAIQDDNAGVKFGALAEKRGSTPEVRQFGTTLRTDNEAARTQAVETAKTAGVTAPVGMSGNATRVYNDLAKLSGPAFDKAFARAVVAQRQKEVETFTAKAGETGKVSDLAKDQLPTLQKQLQTAQTLAGNQ